MRQSAASAGTNAETSRDARLIVRILAGERELFHDLIRPYERTLYYAAYSILRNPADAEDTVQEGILKAYKALPSFRSESKFSTWLATIVLNEARGRLRHERVLSFESIDNAPEREDEITPAVIADWREVPSEALERKEVRELIREAISGLPEIYRVVFVCRDVQELSIAETAATLGISEGLVKVRLLRARLMMQKTLAPKLQTGRRGVFEFLKRGVGASWF